MDHGSASGANPLKDDYYVVTVNGSSITTGAQQNLGYGGNGVNGFNGGFAISKLRTDKMHFLFYVGGTVEWFVISNRFCH